MHPLPRAALKWVVIAIFSWVVVVLFFGGSTAAMAQPVTQPYFVHVWQTEDGLPQNAVPTILQTPRWLLVGRHLLMDWRVLMACISLYSTMLTLPDWSTIV